MLLMRAFILIASSIVTGKTTLARRLLDTLSVDLYESSLLVMVHSGITPEWILTRIAMQLGVVNPAADRMTVLKQLYERLLEIEREGRRAVVLIDEAQMLQTRALMEEFRGLLNLEIPGKKLLNLIFFGLPEVEECLRLDEPLAQRVALRYYLHSLDEDSTVAYIKHRLQVAGAKNMLFSGPAVQLIYRYSGGVPRLINTLCDNCLFEAFMQKLPGVVPKIVQSIAGDLGLTDLKHVGTQNGVDQHLGKIEALLAKMEQKR